MTKLGRKPGSKKTGGRKKGTPNKVTVEIKEAAQQYTALAIERIVHLMDNAESEQVRLSAAKEIIDRGHGKAVQAVEHAGPGGAPIETKELSDLEGAQRVAYMLGAALMRAKLGDNEPTGS